jgi:hypothetical protein
MACSWFVAFPPMGKHVGSIPISIIRLKSSTVFENCRKITKVNTILQSPHDGLKTIRFWSIAWLIAWCLKPTLAVLTFCVQTPLRRRVLDTESCDEVCQW